MPLNNVPQAGQTLAQTRDPIRNNFNSINTAFNANHVDFGLADQGKHKWVTLTNQAGAPAFGATETGFYNALNAVTNVQDTFVHARLNNGAISQDISLTASILSTSVPGNDSNGWSYLPSGILIKWGFSGPVSIVAPFTTPIAFPAGGNIPAFTAIFNVQVSAFSASAGIAPGLAVFNVTTLGFTVRTAGALDANTRIYYFAIGR